MPQNIVINCLLYLIIAVLKTKTKEYKRQSAYFKMKSHNMLTLLFIFIATIQLSQQTQFTTQLIKTYVKTHKDVRNTCFRQYDEDLLENDENFGCLIKCILLKENIINETGNSISLENLKRAMRLPENDKLTGLKEKCVPFDKVDLCKGVVQFMNCYGDYLQTRLP